MVRPRNATQVLVWFKKLVSSKSRNRAAAHPHDYGAALTLELGRIGRRLGHIFVVLVIKELQLWRNVPSAHYGVP